MAVRLIWQVPAVLFALAVLLIFVNECAIARPSRRISDVAYVPDGNERHLLDIYVPKRTADKPHPVIVFIHGGNWTSGSKNTYAFIGRRLAKQGIVALIINYRLAPNVLVPAMADDCARAVVWAHQHVADYGGDANRIFLMGHSAGGGLAALLATDSRYVAKLGLAQNPIKGAILDDPAGLDMFDYLTKMEYPGDEQYLVPFGKDQAVWRSVSALYHVTATCPPMLLYVGERTYPSIIKSTQAFRRRLQEVGIRHEFTTLPGKKHVGMVTQLFFTANIIYRDLRKLVGID